MKIFKLASFGFASAMLVACSDDSGVNTPEGDTLGGIESSSDTGMLDPSGLSSGVLQPGASSAVDLLGVSSSSIAVGPGMSGTGIPMSSSGTLLPTSSAGTPTSSAGFSGNPGSDDTEEDDTVNLNGTETTLTFSGTDVTIANDNGCLEKAAGSVTVKCSGNYYLSGQASDYQVIVNTAAGDTGKVDLFLNGVSLKSSDAPIYVQNAEKAELHLVKGTTNSIEDGSSRSKTYTVNNKLDTTKAAIYAKDDLSIKGSGSLTVKANYNNGIHTSNDLKIKKSTGTLSVTATNVGLKGKGSLTVNGGNITVNAKGDGIKSDEDDAAALAQGKGLVKIAGGTITITSAYDGISASNIVQITKGETTEEPAIKITSGGGQTCLGSNTSQGGQTGGRGGMGGGFGGPGGFGGSSCSPDSSMKGIKADSNLVIEAGKIEINSRDDGIHSDGNLTITGGFSTIKADDDGVHAEKTLTVKDGVVEVTMAYEGMEAAQMNFEGGVTSVITTDDAWNAAGGSSSGGGMGGGFPGGGGRPGSGGNSNYKINVTGGFHYLYVGTGDTDGMDSNGDINMTGGIVVIECRMNGGMGGMVDSDGNTSITGGKMLGFGTNNSEEGTQYSVSFNTNSYYGNSQIAFKPTFSGSKMVSNVG